MESQPAENQNQPADNKDKKPKREPKRGGRGFGKGRGGRRGPRGPEEEEWVPLTNLGRLVKMGEIKKLEQIFYHSIPIKEFFFIFIGITIWISFIFIYFYFKAFFISFIFFT